MSGRLLGSFAKLARDYSTRQERASTTAYEEAGEADLGSCGERRVFAVGD